MFIAPLALIAALNGAPAATAYTNPQPIQVASCALDPQVAQRGFGTVDIPTDAGLTISFVNRDPKTVQSVTFDVNDGGTTSQVVDKGTFSNGVQINQSLVTPQLIGASGVTCSVQAVAFSDGSVWQAQ